MKTFADNAGRNWTITIDVSAIRRLRTSPGVDLMEVLDGRLLEKLATDPVLLVDLIHGLCREQAEAAGVSVEDFGRAMGGDAVEAATTALLEELADFFPSRRRSILREVLSRAKALDEANLGRIERQLAEGELERAAGLSPPNPPAEPPGDTSPNSPGSSA